mmetsp:Transcript_59828/g.71895  ORF Transcript_59828/g.71895 Transcript_59828/m.71895 type:complete len:152 (+) Transcript_59828:172-627(+)
MNFLAPLVIATLLLTSCTEHASAFVAPSSRRLASWNKSLPHPHSARTRTASHQATTTFDFQTNTNVSKKDGLTPMSGITTILSKFASSAQENRKMLRQKTFVKSVALRRVVRFGKFLLPRGYRFLRCRDEIPKHRVEFQRSAVFIHRRVRD